MTYWKTLNIVSPQKIERNFFIKFFKKKNIYRFPIISSDFKHFYFIIFYFVLLCSQSPISDYSVSLKNRSWESINFVWSRFNLFCAAFSIDTEASVVTTTRCQHCSFNFFNMTFSLFCNFHLIFGFRTYWQCEMAKKTSWLFSLRFNTVN